MYITLKDIPWIYQMVKEGDGSFKKKPITEKENLAFWKKKLKSPNFKAWGEKDKWVIRYENNHISIFVAEKHRGKGMATKALKSITGYAGIRKDNIPSQKLFKKLGFKLFGYIYEKV